MPTPLLRYREARAAPSRGSRRGNYAMLVGLAAPMFIGLAALAVDLAYMRLANLQAQDVADAAATAAVYTYRRTRSAVQARAAATQTCAANRVAGVAPQCAQVEFGDYDEDADTFRAGRGAAARVRVAREGAQSPSLFFAQLWGYDRFQPDAVSVAATQMIDVVIVLDITISWSPRDFTEARTAAVAMLDTLRVTAAPGDRLGLVVFNGSFGWEFTPLTDLGDATAIAAVRTSWENLALASLPGDPSICPWPTWCDSRIARDASDFEVYPGGYYPHMPRNYPSEPSTDFYPGLLMAEQMFREGDPEAFRATVLLTDGKPTGVGSTNGEERAADGYAETRWREVRGPRPHGRNDVIADTIAQSQRMYDELDVNTWMISFVEDNAALAPVAQGQGYYERVAYPEDMITAFRQIAETMPVVLRQ